MKNPNLPAALLMTLAAALMMSCDAKWEAKKADSTAASEIAAAKAQENALREGQQKITDQYQVYSKLRTLHIDVHDLHFSKISFDNYGEESNLVELQKVQVLLEKYIRLGYEILKINADKKIPLTNKEGLAKAVERAEGLKTLCDSHIYRIQANNN